MKRYNQNMESKNKGKGKLGVGLAWTGVAIVYFVGRIPHDGQFIIWAIGLIIIIIGSILWAKRKNRHWAFGLWGVLAPVGFLGISLLKDKSMPKRDKDD